MKVSGFSFIRNAIAFDYPIVEAIQSILPLCDEVVVAVGKSEDGTLELIQSIDPKVRVIETLWDDKLREGGKVLAIETDKAFAAVANDSDWAVYIQGDEVMHESYLDTVQHAMQRHKDNAKVDGLLLKYRHFYGSYDYVGDSYRWYRHEIRILKNDKRIYSYRDAQGFRKGNNIKLNVKPIDAYIHHYGWVKDPHTMQKKATNLHKHWHSDEWIAEHGGGADSYDFAQIDSLARFNGRHPKVMKERIAKSNYTFKYDPSFSRTRLKDKIKRLVQKLTGHIIGEYRNYKIV